MLEIVHLAMHKSSQNGREQNSRDFLSVSNSVDQDQTFSWMSLKIAYNVLGLTDSGMVYTFNSQRHCATINNGMYRLNNDTK